MGSVAQMTTDGAAADLHYRVNFVGHFLLCLRLQKSLERGAKESGLPSRVVNLSSVMHRYGDTDWLSPLRFSKSQRTYGTSKLAMAVLASELTRRWAACGVIGIAVNPGAVNSDIWYRGQQPHVVQES